MIGFWLDKNNEELVQENGVNQTVFYGENVSVKLFADNIDDGDEIVISLIAKIDGKAIKLAGLENVHQTIKVKNEEAVSNPFYLNPNWYNEDFEFYNYKNKKVEIDSRRKLTFEFQAKHAQSNTVFKNLPYESVFKLKPKAYQRNYEELLGLFHIKKSKQKTKEDNFENHFIKKNRKIEELVSRFLKEVYQEKKSFKNIESIVKECAGQLWMEASKQAQKRKLDDRPLYWARIKMQAWLKRHPLFNGQIDSGIIIKDAPLEDLIRIFEERSRNYTGIDFSQATHISKTTKKILISGFDPFILNAFDHPKKKGNIFQSNPSGCVALALNNAKLGSGKNKAIVQSMMIPVRYTDFDRSQHKSIGQGSGIIEKYIGLWIDKVDMILTISQSLPGDYHIDKFATARRGGFEDNNNCTRKPNSKAITTDNEWIETTLPIEMTKPSSIKFNWKFNKKTNKVKNTPKSGEKLLHGSGGNYLSNEIFYRVAKLRKEQRPALATGHFHISMLQKRKEDFSNIKTKKLLRIVKKGIEKGIEGL